MKNPYTNLPDYQLWSRAISRQNIYDVDPVVTGKFKIFPTDKVATAGSCFAQHIARHLLKSGFNYFVTEPGHTCLSEELKVKYNYGIFSARYGNLYTPRQLLQLMHRAYGTFTPKENFWVNGSYYIDPFRPQIQPNGFSSNEEFVADQKQHLAAVRKLFEELDIFVFTLGLTESWVSNEDGAVYPICPGVSGGTFDCDRYSFKNFSVQETIDDFNQFKNELKNINPAAKIIITVSPVPLIATAENRHILTSTTLSKSILRVAAEEISNSDDSVAYFPSYEIITGNFNRGSYFAQDLRLITEVGVNHVMRLFLKHYTNQSFENLRTENSDQSFYKSMEQLVNVNCEENAYDINN